MKSKPKLEKEERFFVLLHTALHILDALAAKGFEIDRKKISFYSIKNVGEYTANVDLHKVVKHEVKLSIVAE